MVIENYGEWPKVSNHSVVAISGILHQQTAKPPVSNRCQALLLSTRTNTSAAVHHERLKYILYFKSVHKEVQERNGYEKISRRD